MKGNFKMKKHIDISENLYDRLQRLQKKYEYDNIDDLLDYILDKWSDWEYE